MKGVGDPTASKTVVVGIVGVILLLVVVVFAMGLFHDVENRQIERRVYGVPYDGIAKLRGDQIGNLNSYRWINEKDGVAAIPIDDAIRLTVQELNTSATTRAASQPAGQN